MEKIITVKQEPVDENYVATTSTATTVGNVQVSGSAKTLPTKAVTKPENARPSCALLLTNQATSAGSTSNKPVTVVSTVSQSTPPVVIISGSPVKLTPIRGTRSNIPGMAQIPIGKTVQLQGCTLQGANVTFIQVQKVNAATKQPLAARTQGSLSKQVLPLQVQNIIPISLATSLAKSQATTLSHVTMASSTSTGATVRAIAPKMNIAPAPSGTQTIQLAPKPALPQGAKTPQGQQRIIIPALAANLSSTNASLQFPHGVISGGVVYLPQQALTSGGFPIAVPLAANAFTTITQQGINISVNGTSPEASPPNRPRKPCNCTKSQCLKLYCDCFAQGEFCSNCNCINCSNNIEHEKERSKAIKACLERNPHAFHPKIGKGKVGESERRHNKGCHCKRSGCLKNYCECYEAKILCTSLCKCTGCKNFEESPERKTLMHLADAAEVRVKQQNAAKTKLESQIEDLPTRPPIMTSTGERLPFSFVTEDVAQATCQCLVAQAADAEKMGLSPALAEKMILEEFGRSLLRIIHTASKTKAEQ